MLHLMGKIMIILAATMALSLGVSLLYRDGDALAFLIPMAILCALGLPAWKLSKPRSANLKPREGFVVVALAWVALSVFGALPYLFSGVLPNFFDALFESVSGFTTTGASVMTRFSEASRGIFFWRGFTNWIGGMGVLVLTLAILPSMTGRASHLVRAESPGPSLSKLVPKMGESAKLLYIMYGVLTLIQAGLLWAAGMNLYDAVIHAFATAGTGGFSNQAQSIGAYQSPWIDGIIALFMVLFGVNFALYFKMLTGAWREALRSEELRAYLAILAAVILMMTLNLLPQYGNFFTALRYAGFQGASVMTTTGFATADFNLWPQFSRLLLLFLMFMGGCAGSTAGGLKVVRGMLLGKSFLRQVRQTFQPRKMQVVRWEGKGVEETMLSQISAFFFAYVGLMALGVLLLSLENRFDLITNITASVTCVSNTGPGLGDVGPAGSFSGYGAFGKVVLSFLMLAGRLELFPMLLLFHPAAWRKQ